MREKLKKIILRICMRFSRYSSSSFIFNFIYRFRDPWKLSNSSEKGRFQGINEIIQKNLPPIKTLLEIGSGEGLHSAALKEVSQELTCLEISALALDRAKKSGLQAQFIQGSFLDPTIHFNRPFDLVVASEVIYYVNDVENFIRKMEACGKHCLVSYYQKEGVILDPFFAGKNRSVIQDNWQVYWWKSPSAEVSP